ncbi:hypothetical protein [Actinomadura atramentaria]|uniref:hypothetical protein n=1 Tax=Actinomadura atramentaria TaxID=1990 RepID=UPI0003A57F6A|nr:hypothetical protein [Actinomadura atramentaria]
MPAMKYLTWAAAALVAIAVLRRPDQAAQALNDAASGLSRAAGSVAAFVEELG